ncbi:MAG TPA: HAD family phosphatase [Terracidiphilus sp.]|jgi:beta-phosphoglucomutase family hydrolase
MMLKLPDGDFRAYLFDCDGTIVDSMPLHYEAWKKALADYGCTYEEDLFYAWGGKPVRKIIADLNEMHGLNMPVDSLAERKENYYHAQLPELKGIPEVIEHIEAQHGRIPFAVVSGSRRNSVVGSLTALGLLDKFDVLVCADDYKHGKPAPDGFLLAAQELGVEPEHCLVFEDTALGIEAANAAGMKSVLVAQKREDCGTGAGRG